MLPDVWHNLTLKKATGGEQMSRGSRRCIAIVAATSISILIAACSSSSSSAPRRSITVTASAASVPPLVAPATNPGVPAAPIARQQLHSARTAANYSALDRGMLIYTPLRTLQTGAPVELDVTVIDIGRGPQLTSAPTMYNGNAVDPYDIPTSAYVTVQIICTSDLICQSLTPQNGQFVDRQNEGLWAWRLTAQNPGTALIGIMAVTYKKGSNTFLHATPLWTISLNVPS
jgi:hypothetical protein